MAKLSWGLDLIALGKFHHLNAGQAFDVLSTACFAGDRQQTRLVDGLPARGQHGNTAIARILAALSCKSCASPRLGVYCAADLRLVSTSIQRNVDHYKGHLL